MRPEFGIPRHLLRHILLTDVRKQLLLMLCGSAKQHFEGLSAAYTALDPGLSRQSLSRLKAKLRLLSDAHHLLEHLAPESASAFYNEIAVALPGSAGQALTSLPTDDGGTASSGVRSGDEQCSVVIAAAGDDMVIALEEATGHFASRLAKLEDLLCNAPSLVPMWVPNMHSTGSLEKTGLCLCKRSRSTERSWSTARAR